MASTGKRAGDPGIYRKEPSALLGQSGVYECGTGRGLSYAPVLELHPKSWTHRPTIGGAVLWEKNFSQKNLK